MARVQRLCIASRWDGEPLPASQHAVVELTSAGADTLVVRVDAPYFGEAPPSAAPGPTDRLWEHEVVELFLAADDERYLEIELGPHGHHLVLSFESVRKPSRSLLPLDYTLTSRVEPAADGGGAELVTARWQAVARLPRAYLPARVCRANAYAIHGSEAARCYHAHAPVPGPGVDFHRLECFVPLSLD